MNEIAKKAARRAELERLFFGLMEERQHEISFAGWLEICAESRGSIWRDEAIELIALYGE